MIKNIFLLFLLLLLTACSMFSPIPNQTPNTYVLNAIPNQNPYKGGKQITLLVAPVQSLPAYNTTAIAYTSQPYQLAYFAKNRWAATPAQMLQSLIIQTLQNTHYFAAVIPTSVNGRYDRVLHVELSELQQDFAQQPSVVRLTLQTQLVNAATNQIIATKQIAVIEPTTQDDPYSGVLAANKATAEALQELTVFCLKNN